MHSQSQGESERQPQLTGDGRERSNTHVLDWRGVLVVVVDVGLGVGPVPRLGLRARRLVRPSRVGTHLGQVHRRGGRGDPVERVLVLARAGAARSGAARAGAARSARRDLLERLLGLGDAVSRAEEVVDGLRLARPRRRSRIQTQSLGQRQ